MKQQKGFSLFELIVVIGIVGLLAGGALFSFVKMQRSSAVETTLTDLRNLLTSSRENVRKGGCKKAIFTVKNSGLLVVECQNNQGDKIEDLSLKVIVPGTIKMKILDLNRSLLSDAVFILENNGIGGLSVSNINNQNYNDFIISLSKQNEEQELELTKEKILYGPF